MREMTADSPLKWRAVYTPSHEIPGTPESDFTPSFLEIIWNVTRNLQH